MSAYPVHPAQLLSFGVGFALVVGSLALLTRLVGAKWLLGLFESEGQPSARIVLATTVVFFTLFMEAAGRISDNLVEANYFLAGTLLGLGTGKIIATRWANRPPAPAATIKADKAEVNAQNATITTPPADAPAT